MYSRAHSAIIIRMRAKRILKAAAVAAITAAIVCAAGCSYIVDGIDVSGYAPVALSTYEYFGCETYVAVYTDGASERERLETLWREEILPELEAVDMSLSAYSDPSDGSVARFNAAAPGETVEIDGYAYDTLVMCAEVYADTNGAFNPATARSLDLWGFTDRFLNGSYTPTEDYDREDPHTQLPDEEYVTAFARLAESFADVELYEKDGRYYAVKPADGSVTVNGKEYSLELELGGIGKGVAADAVAAALERAGFHFGYVSVGGSSLVMLRNAARMTDGHNGQFDVSVVDPYSGGHYYRYYCSGTGVSTSGNYRNYYDYEGVRYSHIIGTDGVPYDTGIVAASVFGRSAALCDAYTTALCVLGMEDGAAVAFAQKLDGYDAVFVYDDGKSRYVYTEVNGELIGSGYTEVEF